MELHSMKNVILSTLLSFILLSFFISKVYAKPNLYYARLDVKTKEGVITENKLLLLPATDEYRIESFEYIQVSGESELSQGNDIKNKAKHNAVMNLLMSYGLKSIKCTRETLNRVAHDEVIMSYEGIINHPFKIVNQGFSDNHTTYHVDLEVAFTPLAFPDRWSYLYMKNKIYQTYNDVLSMFQ